MPFLPSAPRPPDSPVSDTEPVSQAVPTEMLSPEEIADSTRRRRRFVLVPVLVAALVGLGFAARPALHVAKAWQARRTAAQAENLMSQGKWVEAKSKVLDALQLWQSEPEAMLAAAHLLGHAGNVREAAAFWTRLEQSRPLTRQEEREFTQDLVASRDFPLAGQHLRKAWPDQEAGTARDWELGMQIAAGEGQASEAVKLARKIVADSSTNTRQKYTAASILASTNQTDIQSEGLKVLLAMSKEKESPESLDALVSLVQRARAETSTAGPLASSPAMPSLAEMLDLIEKHPLAKIQHHLLVIDVHIAQNKSRQAPEIQGAIERFGASKDDDALAVFARWLYSKDEPTRVLDVIPAGRANDDTALFFQRLDALAVLGRWQEVRQSIQDRKVVIDPVIEQMYLARCAEELKEPRVRDARWDAAMDAATGKPDKLMQIGTYAQKIGAADVAIRAYAATVALVPESREAVAALAGAYQAAGDARKTRDALELLAKHHPDDPAVRNDRAYFDALLGENVPAARDTARELTRADPSSLPHRVTLALAELRLGHHLAAMDAFKDVDPARAAMQPQQRAVYAATLWGASFNAQALDIARGLTAQRLLPEERALIQPMLDSDSPNAPPARER